MNSTIKLSAILFATILFLSVGISSAQNYKAVKTDASYYFYDSVGKGILVARIDSIALTANETQYFGMRQIRQTDYSCFIPNGASWLGDVVIEKPNGIYQFVLYPFSPSDSADVFTIKCNALVGESWHFYNYHNTNQYIEAMVTQAAPANFIGISDSVKTITLQRKDASGQNVSDPVNGQKILLSKNYGLIRLPKFDEFNTNLKFLDLCGKTNPVTGRANLTFEEIFDFQLGDEFHIAYDDSPYAFWYPKETGFVIQRILERINGTNADTVSYRIAECKTATSSPGMNQETIINSVDTILVKYIKFNYPAFAYEPKEPQLLENWPFELTENQMGLSATNVLEKSGIPWTLTNATWPLWGDETQQCWTFAMIDDFGNSAYYYKGLGGPYHNYLGIITSNYKKLVYYKKGSETWGTPLSCDSLLHVVIAESPLIQNVKIYPNPTSGTISVSIPANVPVPYKMEIFDISGRLSGVFTLNKVTQSLDLSNIPSGLYNYKLTTLKGDSFRGKIIKQ